MHLRKTWEEQSKVNATDPSSSAWTHCLIDREERRRAGSPALEAGAVSGSLL